MTAPRVITVQDVARLTTLAESTIHGWRHKHVAGVPQGFKLGRRTVFFEAEVLAWIDAQASQRGAA